LYKQKEKTNNTMRIANPIYDVIFKFLMEDTEIAKDLLSLILNEIIVSLELMPQEINLETTTGIRIFRIDFKAIIQKKDGTFKTILIEIQKSKKGFKILRFRRYIGSNYLKEEVFINSAGELEQESLPITTIYFLGFRLKNIRVPVLNVLREYRNASNNKVLKIKENFIELLSHDLHVIQIPRLKMVVKTELEKVLDVFSQVKYKTDDNHIFEFKGDMSDPRVARLVKRLNRATLTEDVIRAMDAEDEVEEILEIQQKELDKALEMLRAEKAAKEQAQLAKEQAEIAKEQERAAKEQERAAKEQALLEGYS
jgi:hypothetical protein